MKHYYGILRLRSDGSINLLPLVSLKLAEIVLSTVNSEDEPAWVVCSDKPLGSKVLPFKEVKSK